MVFYRVIGLRITEFDTVADEIVLHQVGIHTRHDGQFLFLVILNQIQPGGNRVVVHLHLIDLHPRCHPCRINDLVVGKRKGGIGRQYMRPVNGFLSCIGNRLNGGAVAHHQQLITLLDQLRQQYGQDIILRVREGSVHLMSTGYLFTDGEVVFLSVQTVAFRYGSR